MWNWHEAWPGVTLREGRVQVWVTVCPSDQGRVPLREVSPIPEHPGLLHRLQRPGVPYPVLRADHPQLYPWILPHVSFSQETSPLYHIHSVSQCFTFTCKGNINSVHKCLIAKPCPNTFTSTALSSIRHMQLCLLHVVHFPFKLGLYRRQHWLQPFDLLKQSLFKTNDYLARSELCFTLGRHARSALLC